MMHGEEQSSHDRRGPTNQRPVLSDLLQKLQIGFAESALPPETGKYRRVMDRMAPALAALADSQLNELAGVLGSPAPNPPKDRRLDPAIMAASVAAAAIVRGLSADNISAWRFEEHVLPHIRENHLLVLVANQNSFCDSAVISYLLGEHGPRRLIELCASNSFPNYFVRTVLQRGRPSVVVDQTLTAELGPCEVPLANGGIGGLLHAMRDNRWPLIFPEARVFELSEGSHDLGAHAELLEDRDPVQPFKFGFMHPFLSTGPETLGVDPARVYFMPVKVLDTDDLWNPNGCIPNDEFDTIVKFGRAVPLATLRADFNGRDLLANARNAASYLRGLVIGLGRDHLDGPR